jgi:hypothetical protein
MSASPEQIAANRRNSAKSTGPKTPEGIENSKRNGLKHGLTGEGIVLLREDEAEVASLRDELQAELRPRTKLGRLLVGRLATMAVRLEKCDKRESAATAVRVRQSAFDFEDGRIADVEALFGGLEVDPAGSVRKLRRTPEGVDRLIQGWDRVRARLTHPDRVAWHLGDRDRIGRLSGMPEGVAGSRIAHLSRAIGGDFSALEPHDGAGGQLIALIDGEIAALRAHRESFGANFTAIERAEAADIALFDDSNEATRLLKYEATAEQLLYRALRELRRVEAAAATDATTETKTTCEELASSLPEADEAEPGPSRSPKRVETRSPEPSSELDYDARRALARERELRATGRRR